MKLIKIMILLTLAISNGSYAKDGDCEHYKKIGCYDSISSDNQNSISVYELFGKFKTLSDKHSDNSMNIWEFDDCKITNYSVYKSMFNKEYSVLSKYIDLSNVNIKNIVFFKPNGELHFDYAVTNYPGSFHINMWYKSSGLLNKDSALSFAKKQTDKAIQLGKRNKQQIRNHFEKSGNASLRFNGHDNVTFRWRDHFSIREEKAVMFMKLAKACSNTR